MKGSNPFAHPAFFYRGEGEYLAGTMPYIHDGLDAGLPVAAAVPEPRLKLLRAELGAAAERVQLIDMTVAGRNPGRIIPGVLCAFADAHPTDQVRIIGEPIWPGRSPIEYPVCVLHEALINLAFAGRPVSIFCPYDAEELSPEVLADAAVTHPVLIEAGSERASADYAPEQVISNCNRPLPEPHATAQAVMTFDASNLHEAGDVTTDYAAHLGLADSRIPGLELAVTELLTYFVVHARETGTLRVWADGAYLICEVRDGGDLTDPLAGRLPVGIRTEGERAVLLANYIADLVRMYTTPDETTIRLHFALAA